MKRKSVSCGILIPATTSGVEGGGIVQTTFSRKISFALLATATLGLGSMPASAQIVGCSGDDTIFTGRGGSLEEWIQVKPGQGCEMAIEIGARQQGIDFVKIFSKPALGVAGTNGNHKVMYKSNGPIGKDSFVIGIGVISPNGESKLFKRKVNVTIEQ